MIRITEFHPHHVIGVRGAPIERYGKAFCQLNIERIMRNGGNTWTVFESARALFVGGVVPRGGDRLAAWGIFTEYATHHHVLAVHRTVKAVLDEGGGIEVDVDPDYGPGVRWAELLGFEVNEHAEMSPLGRPFRTYQHRQL